MELNSRKIFINTSMLYLRMLMTMFVGIYTSRVVLNVLGFADYGIYNVVGGIIIMFSFFNNAMGTATGRYITTAIGENNKRKLRKIFSHTVIIHILIALVVLLMAETIGLWFLNYHMDIPSDRIIAANWVYQFSVFSSIIFISSNPYYSFIIGYEHMHFYAIASVVDSFLKLGVVFLLQFINEDKLITWAILTFIISFISRMMFRTYAKLKFTSCKFEYSLDKKLIKEMGFMANWSLLGFVADATKGQGVNILLNTFFGVVVNAARGVAYQVDGVVRGFVNNFQTAINPQITKSYASNNIAYMYKIVQQGSKFSFFLLFLITLPLLIETDYVIVLWLKNVPDNTVLFCRLILINSLIESISGPLITAAYATKKIRKLQIAVSFLNILILPISYSFLKLGYDAYYPFIISIIISLLVLISRIFIVNRIIKLPTREYFLNVILKIILVSVLAPIVPLILSESTSNDFYNFLIVGFSSVGCLMLFIYTIGINNEDKVFFKKIIQKKLSKQSNN
jgi:O-antigen/teichoic acid export membrane protein